MGDFYYYYRNNFVAASIFYNETITIAPTSAAAEEARAQLKKIDDGILAPMTPYDWIWGRYQKPTIDQYDEESDVLKMNNEEFEVMSVDAFMETPGAAVGEKIMPDGSVESYETLAPVYGEGLDGYLFDDGFYQWTSDEIQNAAEE